MVKDALGREWQLTTCQLDFVQPENFDLSYINEESKSERPAVLHVAILGSFDRFLAVLIEQYSGAFPLWMAPEQVVVIPISERHAEVAEMVVKELKKAGIRVVLNRKNDPLSKKIRESTLQKVPYLAIIGDKEVEQRTVSVRTRSGGDQKSMALSEFLVHLNEEIERKVE